jgi:hypothetical protein
LPGSITLTYRKITRTLRDFPNGTLTIYINSETEYVDDEVGNDSWKSKKLDLEPGQVEIIVVFEKFNKSGYEDIHAEITEFEVQGMVYAA